MMKYVIVFFLLIIHSGFAQELPQSHQSNVDALMIEMNAVSSHEVVFTNMQSGVLFTETAAEHVAPIEGWRIMGKEILKDYRITIEGRPLRRQEASSIRVYPHQVRRIYPGGVIETVTLIDSINAIVVELDSVRATEVGAFPLFSDSHREEDYVVAFDRNILSIGHLDRRVKTADENNPAIKKGVVAISWAGENLWGAGFYDTLSIGETFSPANTRTVNPASRHVLVIAAGDSLRDALRALRFVAKKYDSLIIARKERMERLTQASSLNIKNNDLDKAFHWAVLSMDALMMSQGNGIFAGIPQPGKKGTFSVSLPGAIIATGNSNNAKQFLNAFPQWQDTAITSKSYGMIPNPVLLSVSSAMPYDFTSWFTLVLNEYYQSSKDTSLVKQLFPAVKRGIGGMLKYRVAKDYQLSSDYTTSFGVRAPSAQFLWYEQLGAASALAKVVKENKSMNRWNTIQKKLSVSGKK